MTPHTLKSLAIALTVGTLTLSGCTTLKQITTKKEAVVARAEKSDSGYYSDAMTALEKGHYNQAATALKNLRTFYPTSRYAQQALLDLIYTHYQAKNYEAVTAATADFIRAYPTSAYIDYALYVQGVTYMQGSPKAGQLFPLNQNERDTAYLRLAFADFQTLVTRHPNSRYAPDAAQRMLAIYNDFAEHELVAARWYVKREAYVAAANRARWVFQYYPQSLAIPESIAILAYSNDKLGLTNTANQYKTLLQINYPDYLSGRGKVLLPNQSNPSIIRQSLNLLRFDPVKKSQALANQAQTSTYLEPTKPQVIRQAQTLTLPQSNDEQIVLPSTQ